MKIPFFVKEIQGKLIHFFQAGTPELQKFKPEQICASFEAKRR